MAKSIKLSVDEWTAIRKRLREDYNWKPSVMVIRSVMLRELGFSVRLHTDWVKSEDSQHSDIDWKFEECIYLDFYDDAKETMFRLKYL